MANKLTAPPPELESETEEGLALPVEPDLGPTPVPTHPDEPGTMQPGI